MTGGASGQCLCGAVSYAAEGPLRDVVNCHCVRCRRHTGHFMAATATGAAEVAITGEVLRWFDATEEVQYGFCGICGSTLFWRSADRPDMLYIAAGTLDPPTGLTTTTALFTADAGDYHRLDDTLQQFEHDH